jgi:pimeloyl-ACP methyl ester carboxylesterase
MALPLALAALTCVVLTLQPAPGGPDGPAPSAIPGAGLPTADRLQALNGRPCPGSAFTCISIQVPLDHFTPGSPLIPVTFAVLPAAGQRRGLMVYATGGPGTAGTAYADSYTGGMPDSIPGHFDIAFFDQRGTGRSGGLHCPGAMTTYRRVRADIFSPAGETLLVQAARSFALDCTGQWPSLPGTAPATRYADYFGTRQAVEDLESFRRLMGVETFYLYGESYGTQIAQTYAAAHRDRLEGLILDGPVDLTLPVDDYLSIQTRAFNDVLVMTLEACNLDPGCAADMMGDALQVYDSLARSLNDPASTEAALSLVDLEFTAINLLYSEGDRTDFLRALAAANRGDFEPLTALFSALASPDPGFSEAAYFAVECNDYNYFSGTPDERARAYLREGDQVERDVPRLASAFYGDLPCVYWPIRPDSESRPAPLLAPGLPTLVLAATADPATPYSNATSIFEHLDDGYLITQTGGPHVIFGWGEPCPDDIVAAFLVEGRPPDRRQITCPGTVIAPYGP